MAQMDADSHDLKTYATIAVAMDAQGVVEAP